MQVRESLAVGAASAGLVDRRLGPVNQSSPLQVATATAAVDQQQSQRQEQGQGQGQGQFSVQEVEMLRAEVDRLKALLLETRQERDAAIEDVSRLRREAQEAQRQRNAPVDASDLPIKPMMATTQSTPPTLSGQPNAATAGGGPRSFHAPSMEPIPGGQGQERVTLLRDEY